VSFDIVFDPVTRIEGHASLSLETDEEGIVEDASFASTTLVRGFEYILKGRGPEFAIKVVQRICGICPIPHGLACAGAVEKAIGAKVPEGAMVLRELLLLGDRLHSHALNQYLLVQDLPVKDEEKKVMHKRLQDIRAAAQTMSDIIGGEAIHPSNIVVGGMKDNISPRAAAHLYRSMRTAERLVIEHRDAFISAVEEWAEQCPHKVRDFEGPMLATDMYYGNREAIDLSAISEMTPARAYEKGHPSRNTSTTVPYYFGEPVETGPRARLTKFKDFHGRTPIDINVARAREIPIFVFRAIELLDDLKSSMPVRADAPLREGEGMCVIEAPRGTDLHSVSLNKDGIITDYNIIAPTTWNMPTIEAALVGNHKDLAPMIVRSFDPCIDCATHCLEIRDLQGHIIGGRSLV